MRKIAIFIFLTFIIPNYYCSSIEEKKYSFISLDQINDRYNVYDNYDNSRDLIALYFNMSEDIFLRVDFYDLSYGAELGYLNVYFTFDFKEGGQEWLPDFVNTKSSSLWDISIAIYDTEHYEIYNAKFERKNESIKKVEFNAKIDKLEVIVDKKVFVDESLDWNKEIKIQAYTTIDSGKITDTIPQEYPWENGWFNNTLSSSAKYEKKAKLGIVHHANQFIKNVSDFVNDSNGMGYVRVLDIHEKYNIPVNLHISGTLAEAIQWFKPEFNNRVRKLVEKGIAHMIGGYYAEYIPKYLPKEVNDWSLAYGKWYNSYYYGDNYTPIAWLPERRIWDGYEYELNGYKGVIIDTEDAFVDYAEPFGYKNEHKVYEEDNGLKILFISNRGKGGAPYNIQDQIFYNYDNGLSISLRELFLSLALSDDKEQYVLYMDDWEKACGNIPDWGGPEATYAYENSIEWIANHKWIEVEPIEEFLDFKSEGEIDVNEAIYFWASQGFGSLKNYDAWYYDPLNEIKNGSSYFNYVPKDTKMKLGDYKTEGTLIYETWKLLKQIPNESQIYELAMKSFSTGLYETAWRGNGKMGLDRDIAYWEKEQAAHVRTSAVYYYAQKWLERKDESIREEDIDFDSENEYIISNKEIFSVFEKKGGKIAYAFDYSGKQIIGNNPTGWLDEGDAQTDAITSTTTNAHYSKKRAKYFEGSKSYSFEDLGYENQLYKPYIDKENKTISFSYGNIKKEFGIIENFIICKYENPSKLSFRISSSPDLKDILLNGKKNIEKIEYGWKNNAKGTRIIFNGTFKGEGENSMIKYMEFEGIKNFTLSVQIGDISSTIPNEKPKIISISPLNYTILPINFTIKVEVVDEESEIKHVEVRIDNNDWFKIKKNKYWEYSLILNEGAHKIDVRAYDGLLYSDIKSILIFVEEKKNSAPIAKAVYYSFKKIVYFDASNSYDFDDDKLIYNWSFGDGKNGSGVVTHHNYEEYGIYDVKLKIDDGKGGVSFENLTIHLSWEKEKNGKENGGNQILMLILILLIISILIIILVHFRKHKRF